MAIFYNYTITVNGNKASLNSHIYLYKNNKNIDYYFTIKNAPFLFKDEVNMIESINASTARIKFIKPNGEKITFKNIVIENGKIKLRIDDKFIDEISEIGDYSFQIDLYDNNTENIGMVTIPPVINEFHVLAPLFDDDEV